MNPYAAPEAAAPGEPTPVDPESAAKAKADADDLVKALMSDDPVPGAEPAPSAEPVPSAEPAAPAASVVPSVEPPHENP